MTRIIKDTKERLQGLEQTVHGGNIWEIADENTVRKGLVIDFSSNINPIGPPERVYEAVRENLWKIRFYPQRDSKNLRTKIAERHVGLTYKNVIVGNGSCELIHLFTQAFVESNTLTLIPIPTFSEYYYATCKVGGNVREVESRGDLTFDVEKIIGNIRENSIIFLCNPNNPTGTLLDRKSITEIVEYASRRESLVFVDEGFIDFTEDPDRTTLSCNVSKYWNLFVLRSLTKSHGLAGLRIGYGIASEEIIEVMHKLKVPWNVNCLAQAAAEAAIDDDEFLDRARKIILNERIWMINRLRSIPKLRVYDSEANFILIDMRPSRLTGREVSNRAMENGLIIRNCSSFRGLDEYHIRVAVRNREENTRLIRFFENLLGYA
ncbi:histidinol-phosphate transaminase [Candidatus Bathyarchaeota archaeon]|nr:histidinol-phosphate transaminase [Candidatus Bathyarchaeota archaeon]